MRAGLKLRQNKKKGSRAAIKFPAQTAGKRPPLATRPERPESTPQSHRSAFRTGWDGAIVHAVVSHRATPVVVLVEAGGGNWQKKKKKKKKMIATQSNDPP